MTSERIKEIQESTAYPNSVSVKQALLQVWNECEQEQSKRKGREDDRADGWVACSERLPESSDTRNSIFCLVVVKGWGIHVHPYSPYHKCWNTDDDDDYFTDAVGGKITHWMPLPSPPSRDNKQK